MQHSLPFQEFAGPYKPVPYTGITVEQTIAGLEGKDDTANIPWYGSCQTSERNGFISKLKRYDIDSGSLMPPNHKSTSAEEKCAIWCELAPGSYHHSVGSARADSQSRKRSQALAEFYVEETPARLEPTTPRAYCDEDLKYTVVPPQTDDSRMSQGVLDSGASISVTNPNTAAFYGLELIPWDTGPIKIQFGSGNIETSYHYVNLNNVFTHVAVIPSAPDTLISIFDLVLAGFEIRQKLVGTGVYLNDELVFPGDICHRTRLFYMDIDKIVKSDVLVPQLSELSRQQRLQREAPATSVTEPKPAPAVKLKQIQSTKKKVLGHKATSSTNASISLASQEPPKLAVKSTSNQAPKTAAEHDRSPIELTKEALWLHKRMGHPSGSIMAKCIKDLTWQGVNEKLTPGLVRRIMSKQPCTACALGKRNKLNKAYGSGIKPDNPGQVISIDYQGKISPVSVRGFTGWFIFKDICTGYRHGIMTKDKSAKTFIEALSHVIDFYNRHGHRVDKLRMDAGSTENSAAVTEFCNEHNIELDPAAVDEEQQNPVEREVQTLTKGVSAMLLDQTALGPNWWCYAVQSWISTANSTTYQFGANNKCPFEHVTGKLESLDTKFLFPFGCPVTCTKVDGRAHHYDTINEFGIAIGSSTGSNRATLVILPGKGLKPFERLHVRPLTIDTPQGATTGVLNLEHLAPTYNDDGIQLFSAAAPIDLAEDNDTLEERLGTLGLSTSQPGSFTFKPSG